jgi:L-lactate dehydrogenase complex protein LldF
MLTNLSEAKDLPHASTLCGACREVCPIRINLPRMLLHLRKELAEGETYPQHRNVSAPEALAMKLWRLSVANPLMMGLANRIARLLQAPLKRNGRLPWLPPPLTGWTRYRSFPAIASRSFRKRWRRLSK